MLFNYVRDDVINFEFIADISFLICLLPEKAIINNTFFLSVSLPMFLVYTYIF